MNEVLFVVRLLQRCIVLNTQRVSLYAALGQDGHEKAARLRDELKRSRAAFS